MGLAVENMADSTGFAGDVEGAKLNLAQPERMAKISSAFLSYIIRSILTLTSASGIGMFHE